MKIKYNRFLAIPFLLLICFFHSTTTHATVTIEMQDDQVFVTTDEVGKAGYKGCETGKLELLSAYVYTLYRKEFSKNKDNQTCPTTQGKWVEVAKKESNLSEEVFLNMPIGEYRATVYAGQAIGCNIVGNTKEFPSKSIVYQQEKSKSFNFSNEKIKMKNTLSNSFDNNDALYVFPNPSSGKISIQLKDHALKSKANITFFNLLGQEAMNIFRSIGDEKYMEWQLDISKFPEGTYVLKISDEEGNSYEQKVLILGK